MMKYSFSKNKKNEVIVLFAYKSKSKNFILNFIENKNKDFLEELKNYNFEFNEFESLFFNFEKQNYLIVGINEKLSNEDFKKCSSIIYDNILKKNKKKINVNLEEKENILSFVEGIELSNYDFDKYKIKKNKMKNLEINFLANENFSKEIKQIILVCDNVKITRDLVNSNADDINPIYFEKISKNIAKKNKLKIEILSDSKLKQKGLNLIHSVGMGSKYPSKLILIEYNGNKNSKDKTALIGKGVTFDTGGINLKPTGFIEDMKLDMGGAATCFGAFKSIVEMKLKKNIVLVLALVENSISHLAYKPGDIIQSLKGDFVEITNTDAEGRLILADAMTYVQRKYKVQKIIDLATLTGAIMVALGPKLIGLFSNDKKFSDELIESSNKVFEKCVYLPIEKEHRDVLKSKFADLSNCGVGSNRRYGGAISAAAFLENFVEKNVKWIHLDIAGAARSYFKEYYIPEFGTGRGVRLLVEYFKK